VEVISNAAAEDGLVVPIPTVPVNVGEAIVALKFMAAVLAVILEVLDAIFVFKIPISFILLVILKVFAATFVFKLAISFVFDVILKISYVYF